MDLFFEKPKTKVRSIILNSVDDIPEALLLFSETGEVLARIDNRVLFRVGGSGSEESEEEGEEEG
jgi:hypothetical protein